MVGRLSGRFFDSEGRETPYKKKVSAWIADALAEKEKEKRREERRKKKLLKSQENLVYNIVEGGWSHSIMITSLIRLHFLH